MTSSDRGPVSVASREVHGPSFGLGTLGLVAVLGLGAGTILGGVIMPLLRSAPPDQSQMEKVEAAQQTNRALLFSMYPQTIYAPVVTGGEPISTGMSVEQYLAELDVRASQAGLSASKLVERKGDSVEISFAFSDKATDNSRTFPQSKTKITHPKTLLLTFASGPLPGTIALQRGRIDGRDRSTGESFIDFVSLGAMPPQLVEGQFLTPRGVFEIKLTGDGVGAFLDGVLVYPAPMPRPGPSLALPGVQPSQPLMTSVLPRRLALQSFQPAIGPLKDRLILVASTSATDTCSAKAVILDAKRGTVIELPEPLLTANVAVTNAKDTLIFNGFCISQPRAPLSKSIGGALGVASAVAPKVEIRLSARYDLKSGVLTWQRETIAVSPTAPVSTLDAGYQSGPSTPWRTQGEMRLASPLVSGGALVSVACRPGGGVTIAVSGLPAPADGQSTGMNFTSGGGRALAQMRWRASAAGYELDGASRPNEARAVLDRLGAGGMMTISAAGATKAVPTPGRAQIDQLVRQCARVTSPTPTATPTAARTLQPAAKPKANTVLPKTQPKSTAPLLVAKTNTAPASKPKPVPVPVPVPKPKPKPTSEAAPPNKD